LLLMALDGGKTKTSCILFNEEGEILALTSTGPSGLILPTETVKRNVWDAITLCLSQAKVKIENVRVIAIGLADMDTRKAREKAQSIISSLPFPPSVKVVTEHDAVIAYYAITYGRPGIAVIAGTGSIAFGMNSKGERARSSGWGWLFGDEGSAFWIAREALAAASRAVDGRGRETRLVDAFMEYFKLGEFLDMIDIVYEDMKANHSEVAKLAMLVNEVAESGDEIATNIMRRAGVELAKSAYAVAVRLEMLDEAIIVGGVGSVFRSNIVREYFYDWLKARLKRAHFRSPLVGFQPIVGSAILALSALGLRNIDNTIANLTKALDKFK